MPIFFEPGERGRSELSDDLVPWDVGMQPRSGGECRLHQPVNGLSFRRQKGVTAWEDA
jgi:hypothetical protein